MRQLTLDLSPPSEATFDNFIVGANAQALAALRAHVALAPSALPHGCYLWGEAACGRTHLLTAAVAAAQQNGRGGLYLAASQIGEAPLPTAPGLLAVDDIHLLPDAAQVTLFDAYNRAREHGQRLLLAGDAPPLALALREELRTRVGQCLVFALHPLRNEDRVQLLAQLARERGFTLEEAHLRAILTHAARDLPSLIAFL
ncbi:MAG: DnaA regulatory inactivator Hda, partial [Rhodocyclaceae bacterium]|nr:DnaA regulatory inactivator Hda [Rhodocyclaceae bacterium]